MLKRTLFFGNPFHLSTEHRQLKVACKDTGELKSIPMEDVGYIVLEHPHITFTQGAMQLMAENNTAVVFCDQKHHPSSMLLHLDTNYVQTERFKNQIQASEPLKKQLWQQTVKQKILNQAKLLERCEIDAQALHHKAGQVRSGDTTNEEAKAARIYWPRLFGPEFTRERYGAGPNPALNYGYAILRAATARALAGSGLLATLGIHHRNKYNSFCLADDIMEPYRPFVDDVVVAMQQEGLNCTELGKEEKGRLLSILSMDTEINGNKSPMMVALSHTSASLVKCFEGESRKINYAGLC